MLTPNIYLRLQEKDNSDDTANKNKLMKTIYIPKYDDANEPSKKK